MKCATLGCLDEARRECTVCSRSFCDKHAEKCGLCEAFVCFECRDVHECSPEREEDSRNA